ncbi:MAG: elongation factor P [Betaproteobacteria bacterium AqS2]|uniref:Elongation factor P n=1 Tax=Candidatus Amphirhobacter heronislandensis TaxID=1732024 RepID=A0A930UDE4_9GAMM|nr:elongation factor P [Betaproteobacteria bacterium AqS2]
MPKIAANELRPGMLIEHNGALCRVVASSHVHVSGRGGAGMQVELRAVQGGAKLSHRFRTDEKVERPFVDRRRLQYLYSEGEAHVFMDLASYEQTELGAELLEGAAGYLTPDTEVEVSELDGAVIGVDLPAQVELEIAATEPHIKGATATSSYKPATTSTGITVMVPPFIKQGETVRVSTATGEYLERAS